MSSPDPFITTQDVVDLYGRGDVNDPGLIIAVDAACDMVRTLTETTINAGTATVNVDGTGTDALLLPELPVTKAGTVLLDGGTITDYCLGDKGMLFRGSAGSSGWDGYRPVWPRGRQNVTVTMEYGWGTADVPRDLRAVALNLATRLWAQGPVTAETIGRQISVTYGGAASDLTTGEERIIAKYRRVGP